MNSSHPGRYAAIPLWLRPITRRPGEVQFGVLEGGPIVTGVTPDEARLLARLDGTLPADALGVVAKASGVSKRRWRVLLDLVVRLGLLEPAPDDVTVDPPPPGVAAPGAPRVLIEGSGPLAHDLSHLLRRETAGGIDSPGPAVSHPTAVVLVGDIALDPRRGDIWLARGVPHLPVVTAGTRAAVGPLVDGASGSPCLWCLDLHRSDRDEAWPTVMAQVATVPGDPVPPRGVAGSTAGAGAAPFPRTGEPGLAQLVAGTVTALVARVAVGERPPAGVAVEVSLPWPRLDHRRWRPHPRCHHPAWGQAVGTDSRPGDVGVA